MPKLMLALKERPFLRVVVIWVMALVTVYALVEMFGPDRVWGLVEWAFGSIFGPEATE